MPEITHHERLMNIITPLGENALLINKVSANEGLSELFSYELELFFDEENKDGVKSTDVKPESLLCKAIAISVTQNDKTTKRQFNGMIARFSSGRRLSRRFSVYYATVVPHIWLLTRNTQSRIFQQMSVPDILKKVFSGFDVAYEHQGNYAPRNYCVQYRETDFDFASRLMEEEGIYYYFKHEDGKHQMVIGDTPQKHLECPSKSSIPFFIDVAQETGYVTSIQNWRTDYQLQTGKITLWDYSFQLPDKHLEATKPLSNVVGDTAKLEFYDYPGGYSRWFDGISKAGGEQDSELNKVFEDNMRVAQVRMQEQDVRYKTAAGVSDCSSITAGYYFTLTEHPDSDVNGKYLITSVNHEIEQTPNFETGDYLEFPYRNSFSCIPHGTSGNPPFRPLRKTAKPIIYGSQTAVVVGPGGEEIFTDKYGRVKVQFKWDREGQSDAGSSCWVRVAQSWASKSWGSFALPRIGMEVIVHFLEGDPDQPIITGCVYNAGAMPPYKLPDYKTKTTIKSDSSPGGGGFNEFRIEDKKGEEQIFIHAEKDFETRVKKDLKELVKNDRHLIVENSQFEKVKTDKHLQVGGDHNEKITSTMSLNVGEDLQEKVGQNYALDAGMAVHIKAGMTVVIEAGASLTLKVGGSNYINISPAGVAIAGTMVMINSGGAPGSGAGSSPDTPADPIEACDADPGSKPPVPSPEKPASPVTYSPMALSMQNAANSGVPFCAICSQKS